MDTKLEQELYALTGSYKLNGITVASIHNVDPIITWIDANFISKQELVEKMVAMKCDERKTKEFGNWVAETYNDKMLVNSVLDEILALLQPEEKEDV